MSSLSRPRARRCARALQLAWVLGAGCTSAASTPATVAPVAATAAAAHTSALASTPGEAAERSAAAVGDAAADPALAAVTLPPRPEWMDKYAGSDPGDPRFFVIDALMRTYGLGRAQAIELQNHHRDLTRAAPELAPAAAFRTALERAQAGTFERPRDEARLRDAPFIVVFDLDETLYDQYLRAPEACPPGQLVAVPRGDGSTAALHPTPGWDAAIERLHALGGAVVIFSANRDVNNRENLAALQLGGVPVWDHPKVAAIATNSHLVLQSKHEGEGASDPRRGHPVPEPFKDLRMFDESLTRVILVDDNPLRVAQHRNLRLIQKFDGDARCAATDPAQRRAWDRSLAVVVAEIEQAVAYMQRANVDFATAYLPFTQLGQLTVQWLIDTRKLTRAQAIAAVRREPSLVPREF
jgi:hypothetical protein